LLCTVDGEGAEAHLVMDIAGHVHYWILYQDIQLQTLAVKIISHLSLVKSKRTAIADAGILNDVIRKYSPF